MTETPRNEVPDSSLVACRHHSHGPTRPFRPWRSSCRAPRWLRCGALTPERASLPHGDGSRRPGAGIPSASRPTGALWSARDRPQQRGRSHWSTQSRLEDRTSGVTRGGKAIHGHAPRPTDRLFSIHRDGEQVSGLAKGAGVPGSGRSGVGVTAGPPPGRTHNRERGPRDPRQLGA